MEKIGRYEIEHEIGRGAMGIVYRALDPVIGRRVAVKTIRMDQLGHSANTRAVRERLFREAQSAGILSHPNIVTIYDIAEDQDNAYIFMEYVEGTTLDSLARGMPRRELIAILEQAAEALDYAHARGIVHRDIKPGNLMLSGTTLKVTDFGVARLRHRDSTQSGTLLGTPSYMSPEQVAGAEVTGAADQYSLGVVAYEFLAGVKPFENDNLANLLYRITQQEAPPVPWLPEATNQVFRRVLAKRPTDRFSSCQEFIAALASSLGESIAVATPHRESAGDEPTVANIPAIGTAVDLPPPVPRQPPPSNHTAKWIFGILLGITAFAATLWYFLFLPAAPPPPGGNTPVAANNNANDPNKPSPVGNASGSPASAGPTTERPVEKEPTPADSSSPGDTAAKPPDAKPVETRPQDPSPASRTAAGAYSIGFTSHPDGAEILIDDGSQDRCPRTPCTLEIPSGVHRVTARLEGFAEFNRNIRVPEDSRIFLELEKPIGTLVINSNPAGANLRLNGRDLTEKTPALLKLPAGRYKLEVVKEGLPVQMQDVVVRNGVTQTLTVNWNQ